MLHLPSLAFGLLHPHRIIMLHEGNGVWLYPNFRVSRLSWLHTGDHDAILNALFRWLFKKVLIYVHHKERIPMQSVILCILFLLIPLCFHVSPKCSHRNVHRLLHTGRHIFTFHCHKIIKYLVMDYRRREQFRVSLFMYQHFFTSSFLRPL